MKLLTLLKRNKSFRNLTIIITIGWVLLVCVSLYLLYSDINEIREYEVNDLEEHYTQVFSDYNDKIILISAYFTTNSIIESPSEYSDFIESVVNDNDTITSVSIAPSGVVEHIWPSTHSNQIGYDIMGSVPPHENIMLLESIDNNSITYAYRTENDKVTEILIRKPIIIDDVFYGFITMSVDNSVFARADFSFSSPYLNTALFTSDEVIIYGLGESEDYILHELEVDNVKILVGESTKNEFVIAMSSNVFGFVLTATLIFFLILVITGRYSSVQDGVTKELNFRKNYDAETSLYNLDRLYVDVQRLIDNKEIFFLCFININNVKYINEKFGHTQTSNLVKKTTGMIDRVLRNNSILYRYGGDEYVLISRSTSKSEVKNLLRRIVKIFESDIISGSIRTRLGIEIGVTQYPSNGYSVEELINNAHLASSSINTYDKEAFKFYRADQISNMMHNADFDKLVSSLDLELFEVSLMPIVDVQTNLIGGFECLTRAYDNLGGRLPTEDTILSLERNGKIQLLDEIVFRKMLQIMRRLNKEFPDQEFFISLNASALSLNDEYVNNVIEYYQNSRIKKGTIVLELTESYQVEDYDYLINLFKKLNDHGIKVAIDDFGSGYSSISYISKFPIYAIKVDKEYVRDYKDNDFNVTLLKTLKSIASVLDCKLVAEGVDSPDTLEFLKDADCPFYQGYLFSKALPYEDAVALIKNNLSENSSNNS